MTGKEPIEAVAVAAEVPAKKPKTKGREKTRIKAKPSPAKAAKPAKPGQDFDFVGKVEVLRVRSGAGPEGLEFGFRGRHSKRKIFRFDAAGSFAMNAMAQLVLAAHASEPKIGVRTGANVDGVLIGRDLEIRPKRGKGV